MSIKCNTSCYSFEIIQKQQQKAILTKNRAKAKHVIYSLAMSFVRNVWRYDWGNQKPSIEVWQTISWPKVKRTKKSTMIYKTLHRKIKIEQRVTSTKRKYSRSVTQNPEWTNIQIPLTDPGGGFRGLEPPFFQKICKYYVNIAENYTKICLFYSWNPFSYRNPASLNYSGSAPEYHNPYLK